VGTLLGYTGTRSLEQGRAPGVHTEARAHKDLPKECVQVRACRGHIAPAYGCAAPLSTAAATWSLPTTVRTARPSIVELAELERNIIVSSRVLSGCRAAPTMRRSGARSIWVLAGFVGSVCALGPVPTQVISVAKTLARGSFLRISADMSGGLPLDHWKTRSVRFPSEGPVESLCNIWRQQGGLPAFWAGTPAVLFQGFFCGALLMAAKVSPSLARALFLALALLLSLSLSLSLSGSLCLSRSRSLTHTLSRARSLSLPHPALACVRDM
jgi:hypothetical protein